MSAKTEAGANALDTVKLIVATAVLIGGVVAFYYFAEQSVVLRALGVVVAVGLSLAIVMQSTQGRELWRFVQGSRVELRKVVWPTRQEALQTTMIVIVFVLIMGVFFWLLDLLLLWVTRMLTGQGG